MSAALFVVSSLRPDARMLMLPLAGLKMSVPSPKMSKSMSRGASLRYPDALWRADVKVTPAEIKMSIMSVKMPILSVALLIACSMWSSVRMLRSPHSRSPEGHLTLEDVDIVGGVALNLLDADWRADAELPLAEMKMSIMSVKMPIWSAVSSIASSMRSSVRMCKSPLAEMKMSPSSVNMSILLLSFFFVYSMRSASGCRR
jgi:hypothetical protein